MDKEFASTDNIKWAIDRFEEHNAILENSETFEMVSIPMFELPAGIVPGDILIFQNDTWHLDHAEKEALSASISQVFQRIKQKNL